MSHGAVAVHAAAVPAFHAASKAAVIMPPPSSSRLYSVGSNACSFALRSLHDTKETFLMVCISFLDALDALQTKLYLSTSLVKELKRVLSKMVDRSLTRPVAASTHKKMQQAQSLGEAIAASDAWHDVAKPEDVKGFVHWLVSAMRWINELALAGTVGVYRRVCILVMSFPGVPTACGVFCRIFDLVEHTLQSTLGYGANNGGAVAVSTPRRTKRAKHAHYMDNSSLTAVVLEYREKECMVPVNINRRIQQFMHFEIPLRSFEATVRLRSSGDIDTDDGNDEDTDLQQLTRSVARGRRGHHITGGETTTTTSTNEPSSSSASSTDPSSSSPRSIPASPRERRKFNLIYGNYFDNVLYEARDKLRLQRAVSLTGETQRKIPRFNKSECAQEVHLTCGRNCAVKEGPGMYRSVRGTVPILRNRYVYFEMKLSSDGVSSDATRQTDVNACIGIAPRSMPLNCLVGTSRNSVGLSSVGQILLSGQYRRLLSVSTRFGCPSTVGVLVFICDEHEEVNSDLVFDDCNRSGLARADVQFSVNGSAVLDDDGNILITSMVFPAKFDMYPTLSLHTEGLRVYAQFSSPDIATFNPSCFALSVDDADEVVCLDGLKVPRFQ